MALLGFMSVIELLAAGKQGSASHSGNNLVLLGHGLGLSAVIIIIVDTATASSGAGVVVAVTISVTIAVTVPVIAIALAIAMRAAVVFFLPVRLSRASAANVSSRRGWELTTDFLYRQVAILAGARDKVARIVWFGVVADVEEVWTGISALLSNIVAGIIPFVGVVVSHGESARLLFFCCRA
jgi:hypothetical protein